MKPTYFQQLITDIRTGALDSDLASIANALQGRRDFLSCRKINEFHVHGRVKFNSSVNPKYLVGVTAIITKVNRKRVVVNIEPGQYSGRFTRGIRCPVSILEAIPA